MMKEPIIEKLKKHIDMLLKVYVGGESYFDKLDDFIKNNPMLLPWVLCVGLVGMRAVLR